MFNKMLPSMLSANLPKDRHQHTFCSPFLFLGEHVHSLMTVYFPRLSTASIAEWWLWEVIKKWIKSTRRAMGWNYVSAGVNIILLMTWIHNHFKLTFLLIPNISLQRPVLNLLQSQPVSVKRSNLQAINICCKNTLKLCL